MAAEKDPQFASTLASAVDLLLCFQPGESSLSNRDFAQRTGLSRPAVARLTHTLEILGYIAQGMSNKSIAKELNISHDTVKLHVRHILAKLNLSSRVEAAVYAVGRKFSGSTH